MRTIKISQVVNRKAQQIGQQFAFRGPDAVEMGEIRYSLREDCKQFMVRYMSVIPIEPILFRPVSRHGVGTLEAKRFANVLARHGQFLDDYLVLWPAQKFEIYDDLHFSNDKLTLDNLPFIEDWNCTDRLCPAADETLRRRLVPPVGPPSRRHRTVRRIVVECNPCPCREQTDSNIRRRHCWSALAVFFYHSARCFSCAARTLGWRGRAVPCRTNQSNMRRKTWVGIGRPASVNPSPCEDLR
jgi:hypothetical protein